MAVDVRPWQAVPAALGELLCDAIPSIADEVVAMLGEAMPTYRTLDGPFGRDVIQAVADALHDFAGVIEHRPPTLGAGRALYTAVGERWWRSGHSLDDLQAGYHLGARVVWRRIAAVATDAGFGGETISVLADSLFAYLDEIAAASVDGFVAAQTAAVGETERRRQHLIAALVGRPPADRATLERRARELGWALPRTLAVLAIPAEHEPLSTRRLPTDALVGLVDSVGCIILPDPDGPGRRRQLESALRSVRAALGPTVAVQHAAHSWSRARALWLLMEQGRLGDEPAVRAADHHLLELLLAKDPSLVDDLAALRLAPLHALPPRSCQRLEATLLAYLRHRGNGPRIAADLQIHPQTVRYRLARLRDLLGDALEDPEARFELEVVLRARSAARPL